MRYENASQIHKDLKRMGKAIRLTNANVKGIVARKRKPASTAKIAPERVKVRLKPELFSSLSSVVRTRNTLFKSRVGLAGVLVVGLTLTGLLALKRYTSQPIRAATTKTVAVLPFQNLTGDQNLDYLRFALADEIASVLANSGAVEVRSSSITRRYLGSNLRLPEVGRQLHVRNIVSGRFVSQEEGLLVTLEDLDVASNRVLLQTSISSASTELTSFQAQLYFQLRRDLLPILGSPTP